MTKPIILTFQPFDLPTFQPSNLPTFKLSNLPTFPKSVEEEEKRQNLLNTKSVWKQEKQQNPLKKSLFPRILFYCFKTFLNMESVWIQEKRPNPLNTECVYKQKKWPNSLNTECVKKHGNNQILEFGRHGMIFLAMLKQYLQKNQQYFLKDKLKDLWERFNNILSVSNLSTFSYFWCLETEETPWKNQRILLFYCFQTLLNSESVYKHEKWPNPLNTKVSRNMETTKFFEYGMCLETGETANSFEYGM